MFFNFMNKKNKGKKQGYYPVNLEIWRSLGNALKLGWTSVSIFIEDNSTENRS